MTLHLEDRVQLPNGWRGVVVAIFRDANGVPDLVHVETHDGAITELPAEDVEVVP